MTTNKRERLLTAVDEVAKEARNEALDEVLSMLGQRIDVMTQILTSETGITILSGTTGDSFDRHYETRQKLWRKLYTLQEISAHVGVLRYGKLEPPTHAEL